MTVNDAPRPLAPTITDTDLARQFWLDIYGKEVQSAATYSYMWMADQAGHVGIGILLHFALTPIFAHLPQAIGLGSFFASDFRSELAGFIATALLVSYWEYSAYRTDVKKAQGSLFPLQEGLLKANAIVAAAYMALGGGIGWALHLDWYWAVPVILGIGLVMVLMARPWLRQKIIWQKVGLPYLTRLADLAPNMPSADADALWKLICAPPPPAGPPKVVVVAGALRAGRILMACGIGTEFAFKAASVRYMSLNTLLELATTGNLELVPPLPGPSNVGYWPWSQAQVLIIDNIGPLVSNSGLVASSKPTLEVSEVLEKYLAPIRTALASRHTVWMLGSGDDSTPDDCRDAAEAIGRFLGAKDPMAILLGPTTTMLKPQSVNAPASPA